MRRMENKRSVRPIRKWRKRNENTMVYSSDGGDNGSMRIGNADEGTGWMAAGYHRVEVAEQGWDLYYQWMEIPGRKQ